MLEHIRQLISIPSISGQQKECNISLDYALSFFTNLNVTVEKKEFESVVSAYVTNATDRYNPDILFLCHLDVVAAASELFKLRVEGDKLFGRGVFDMKGPTLAVLEALKSYFQSPRPNLGIGLLLVTDEEVGGEKGAGQWAKILNPTVVLEPDSAQPIDSIIERAKQPLFVRLIAKGDSAHGSRPWLGIDAIENLIQSINKIRETGCFKYYEKGSLMPEKEGWVSTMHIGKITGGNSVNAIADYAMAELDFRLTEDWTAEKLFSFLRNTVSSNITIEPLFVGVPVVTDLTQDIACFYKKTVEKRIKKEVRATRAFGATDGRYFAQKSILLTHQATGGNAHGEQEWVSLSSLELLRDIYTDFLTTVPVQYFKK